MNDELDVMLGSEALQSAREHVIDRITNVQRSDALKLQRAEHVASRRQLAGRLVTNNFETFRTTLIHPMGHARTVQHQLLRMERQGPMLIIAEEEGVLHEHHLATALHGGMQSEELVRKDKREFHDDKADRLKMKQRCER